FRAYINFRGCKVQKLKASEAESFRIRSRAWLIRTNKIILRADGSCLALQLERALKEL
ncbi:hypothetical protein A2U01_0083284, partial [Trifolium medium]|nr:hypothetical protein [Trifolium medium]